MLALIFLLATLGRAYLNPQLGPPRPLEERQKSLAPLLKEFVLGFIPPAVLIFSTLGTILLGLATPTEGAAMGAFGAFLLVIVFRRPDLSMLTDAVFRHDRTARMILVLVAAFTFFGAGFARLGPPPSLTEWLRT